MTARSQNQRRALIVRRAAAQKQSAAAKRMWAERRTHVTDDEIETGSPDADLAELPDILGE